MDGHMIYTVGHSTHEMDSFLELLRKYRITAVADVRSEPSSRLAHFSGEVLSAVLRVHGIQYVFIGRELGARRSEPECYIDGQAVYELVASLPRFRAGLDRLMQGAQEHIVAVMCAEKEPLDCHRTILVCRHLRRSGLRIRHILADGRVEEHEQTEKRLVDLTGVGRTLFEPDLTDAELIERAYEQRGREIAYRMEAEEVSR